MNKNNNELTIEDPVIIYAYRKYGWDFVSSKVLRVAVEETEKGREVSFDPFMYRLLKSDMIRENETASCGKIEKK